MASFRYNPAAQKKESAGYNDPFLSASVPISRIFVPKIGPSIPFRLMPPWSAEGVMFRKVPLMWKKGMQQRSFVSPHYFEEGVDPFMNAWLELLTVYRDHAEDQAFLFDFNQVRPQDGWYYNVVANNEKAKGPQVYRATYQAQIQIENLLNNGEYGFIADPEVGFDLTITLTKKGQKQDTMIVASRFPTKIENEAWLDNLFNIDTVLQKPDLEDVWACFNTIPFKFYKKPAQQATYSFGEEKVQSPVKVSARSVAAPVSAPAVEDDLPDNWEPDGKVSQPVVNAPVTADINIRDQAEKAKVLQAQIKASREAAEAAKAAAANNA